MEGLSHMYFTALWSYLEIIVSFMTVLPIQTTFTIGTRKRMKLFFHKDLFGKWIYSFIMKYDVHVINDYHGYDKKCCAPMESKHSLGPTCYPPLEMKLVNWILWTELAVPWLHLFLPLRTINLLKFIALAEQHLDVLYVFCSCDKEF